MFGCQWVELTVDGVVIQTVIKCDKYPNCGN